MVEPTTCARCSNGIPSEDSRWVFNLYLEDPISNLAQKKNVEGRRSTILATICNLCMANFGLVALGEGTDDN